MGGGDKERGREGQIERERQRDAIDNCPYIINLQQLVPFMFICDFYYIIMHVGTYKHGVRMLL